MSALNDLVPTLPQHEPLEIIEMYCSNFVRPERVLVRYEIVVQNYDGEVQKRVYRNLFPVTGETAASWFIDDYGKRRTVLKGDGKRFAYDSDDKALFSLRKRTRWRQAHAHWALTKAHLAIEAYNELFANAVNKPLEQVGTL